jgi:hypothetical protein
MLRRLIGAAVLVLVSATAAPAQITGPVPNMGQFEDPRSTWNPWIGRAEVPEDAGREHEIQRYRETLKTKIPDRKPSNDPWRSIRPASTTSPGKQHERE